MSDSRGLSEWDNVRVVRTPKTVAAGVADKVGQIHGFTTPSVTGVKALGPHDDFVWGVYFDDLDELVWLPPGLLEFVDHAPGTELRVGGKVGVREADGEWSVSHDPEWQPRSRAPRLSRLWARMPFRRRAR